MTVNATETVVQTDVAIVGAGGCGLTAALAASERGAQVVLLERDAVVGGSTAMSAGIIVAAESELQRASGERSTASQLAADIMRLNGGQGDAELTNALCSISGRLVDWLAGQGVPLEPMPGYRYPGMSQAWMLSSPQRWGSVMTEALLARVKQQPVIELFLSCPVTGLTTDNGAVTGLKAMTAIGKLLTVRAKAVILASSGFGANAEMVGRYIPDVAGILYYGATYADGSAIQWGQQLGAAVAHMGAYQSHSSVAHPNLMLVTTYLINHGAIQVNQHGRRFGDETDSYAGHALTVQEQPGRAVVEIFDDRILSQTLADYPRFEECVAAGIVHRAETISGLARLFGLPEEILRATIEQYADAVRAGQDPFGRKRFGSQFSPPYYGIRVTSALVQTLGGLRVDARARVIRADRTPVTALYAGGGAAAGLAGDRPEGYMAGTGLLAAFGLGWIAGREAARS